MKKSIILIVMVIAIATGIFVASAASPGEYTLTVTGAQNTALQSINTTFGTTIVAGTTTTINPSFNATNAGNQPANVSVKFTSFNGSVYGFTGTGADIAGSRVDIQHDALGWNQLNAIDSYATITGTIAADNAADNFGIEVRVPAGQLATAYTGTIEVAFS